MSKASSANRLARRAARILPAGNGIRSTLSGAWTKFLLWRGQPIEVELSGTNVLVHPHLNRFPDDYEADALASFKKLLHPGIILWDVGANIGIYSLVAINHLAGKVTVRSWEPNPVAFAYLEQNFAMNALSTAANAPVAVFEAIGEHREETLDLYAPSDRYEYGRILTAGESKENLLTVKVTCHSLDYWSEKLSYKPQMIKIDVEGAEAVILRGSKSVLDGTQKDAPLVLLSAHPYTLQNFGSSVADLDQRVRALGYEIFDLGGQVTSITTHAEYWLVPKARVAEVVAKLQAKS